MPTLLDTHYHLDFIPSLAKQVDFVQHRHQGNKGIVAQTVLPSKFAALSQTLDEFGGSQPLLSLRSTMQQVSHVNMVRRLLPMVVLNILVILLRLLQPVGMRSC